MTGYVDISSFLSLTTFQYEILLKKKEDVWKDLYKNLAYIFLSRFFPVIYFLIIRKIVN
jgi:hypothetical protein